MRSVVYRFPDLTRFEGMVLGAGDSELELGLPSGEVVDDGEWVLAIFELGSGRRATSAAARSIVSEDGARLVFEPRDWQRLADFARSSAAEGATVPPAPMPSMQVPPPVPAEVRGRGPSTAPRIVSTRPPTSSSRVLVVDDDPDIRDVVSAMLEAVGLAVTTVDSAEHALERVRAEPFDLLVLDWNLPAMTGLELCRQIRREPGIGALPVLFLTANASSQDMVDAFAVGADDYVVKPFRAPELGARIFALLRRARRTSGT